MNAEQKIHVTFADQAIRNHLAMQAIREANLEEGHHPVFYTKDYVFEEFRQTQKIMAERQKMDMNEVSSFACDMNACKTNKNDYIFLQTRVVHALGSILDMHGRKPATFDLERFDTNKIAIGKYNRFAGLFMRGDEKEAYKEAMSHIRLEIFSARRQMASLITRYFGME